MHPGPFRFATELKLRLDRRLQTDFNNRFTRAIAYDPVSSLEIGLARYLAEGAQVWKFSKASP
jgi:hypothetical protein